MKRLSLIIASMLFTFSSLMAQEKGTIQGKVLTNDTLSPLPQASIYLSDGQRGTSPNGKGEFVLKDLSPGQHILTISNIGYSKVQDTIELEPGATQSLTIYLKEKISNLPPVMVENSSLTGGTKGVRQIPGSASYLSPDDLEQQQYTDVHRTLREVPGVNLREEDGFGLRPNIGLRGTGTARSSKITIMEDGVLSAPAPYSAPSAYYFPTMGRMYAMEVLKGSSQIKYGPFTTGGALNFISTKIPEDRRAQVQIWGGSFGNRNLHAVVGNSHDQVSYMAETFQYGSDGFKDLDGGDNTGFYKQDYLGKIRVQTSPDALFQQSLSLKLGYMTETSNETYLGLTREDFKETPYRRYAASQNDEMNTEHSQASLRHYIEFSDRIELTTTLYRNDFARNWYKLGHVKDASGDKVGISDALEEPGEYRQVNDILKGGVSSDDALGLKANNREYYSQGIQSVLGTNFKTGPLKHRFSLGFRYHQDQVDRFQWVDAYRMKAGELMMTSKGKPGTESNRIQEADAMAGYLQYQAEYGNFTLTPGLRYENILMKRRDFGTEDTERTGKDLEKQQNRVKAFMPGIGLNYAPADHINTFAGIHKGFAPPGANPKTHPEESINYEAGFRYTKGRFKARTALFYNDYQNLLGADLAATGGAGTIEQFNGGRARTQGIELTLSHDLYTALASKTTSLSLPVSLNYTFTDAVFQNDFDSHFKPWGDVRSGDRLPFLAQHQFSLSMGLDYKRFRIDLNGSYNGDMRSNAGQGAIPEKEKIPAYHTLDMSIHYDIDPGFSLFLRGQNLTDEVYMVSNRPAGLRPGLPRTIQAGLKAEL